LTSIEEIELYSYVIQDENLNIINIIIIIDFIIDNNNPTKLESLIADINQDGSLDIFDVVLLVEEIL
tara:strand:- start:387 stop:587 length:201 start_codon:yes stop_codon:yes gene_type:complete